MKVLADLHIHSKYSRAVSQKMTIAYIWEWASIKGIDLVATSDWTHPLWFREIKKELEEVGNGILKLKASFLPAGEQNLKLKVGKEPHFILSTEISSIYSQGGQGRRIHLVVFAPSVNTAEKICQELTKRGVNLISDGRPILGLSSQEIAELIFSIDPKTLIIPAHIWTPWFSMYGSQSGFDTVEECFGDYSKYIYAIETGLSSDPVMNWRIKELDQRSIVSFSDAHSGPKLGREVTVFELEELSFDGIRKALMERKSRQQTTHSTSSVQKNNKQQILKKSNSQPTTHSPQPNRISYTIEFHPEEGKYHYTGHRNCNIRQEPEETKKNGVVCPVCGKKLTVGVMHRVEELAKRSEQELKVIKKTIEKSKGVELQGVFAGFDKTRPPYIMLVPLQEIIAEVVGTSPTTQKVQNEYKKLTDYFHSEFNLLLNAKLEEIEKLSGEKMTRAIHKVRTGSIVVEPGYDGVFGVVKIWGEEEKKQDLESKKQMSLF